jgi:hypothetical protein
MQPPDHDTPAPASLDRAVTRLRQAVGYLDEWHAQLTTETRSYVAAGQDALAAIDATLRALLDARAALAEEVRRDEDERASRVDELLARLRKPEHDDEGEVTS